MNPVSYAVSTPSPLTYILEEASDPPFHVVKKLVPKGKILEMYDADAGAVRQVMFDKPFYVMVLAEEDEVWMSTTPFEYEGIRKHLERAHGDVLVGGLGLGVFPFYATRKGTVKLVDIVEKEEKVISLVYNQLQRAVSRIRRKCRVIHDDIYSYLATTPLKYDFIFLDIWQGFIGPIKDLDNAVQAACRCLKDGGEVHVWMEELVNRVKGKLPGTPTAGRPFGLYDPCLICGKTLRYDYAGLCMDCADVLKVSEIYVRDGRTEQRRPEPPGTVQATQGNR